MLDRNLIRNHLSNTISEEAKALDFLSSQMDDTWVSAVELIFQCRGRLVITGIGKSALIAQKIVATLNSTGTNAIFMHAADAIHGDLGMIHVDDIVMCISKSGETPEIKVLVPLIKGFGNTLIALTSGKNSSLARMSNIGLILPMESEADPNNLAPTTSTILQMAAGDAIAISLLALRGFTRESFARLHPGGNLGKQLYLTVGQIVDKSRKPRTYLSDPLTQIIYEMSSKRYGATVVFDDNENLIGIITDGDLRRMLEQNIVLSHIDANHLVNKNPLTILSSILAVEALKIMEEKKVQQLIVIENNHYVGLIHIHELLYEGIA
jgi:arabinose-5-phosphate isomerase